MLHARKMHRGNGSRRKKARVKRRAGVAPLKCTAQHCGQQKPEIHTITRSNSRPSRAVGESRVGGPTAEDGNVMAAITGKDR